MTPRKLEILQKRLEKAADDFRGLQFYCSVFYEDVLNKEIQYSHIPDKCIFKDIRWDGEGKPYEITDQIIDCCPEHYSEGPPEFTHKPMRLENGEEFAAYLVRPYEADWNTSFALTTLNILGEEIFPFVLEAVITETSPWKINELFSSYENGELNEWIYDMNLSKTCRVLLTMQIMREIPKIALGGYPTNARPNESYYRETRDVFLELAFLSGELLDFIKKQWDQSSKPGQSESRASSVQTKTGSEPEKKPRGKSAETDTQNSWQDIVVEVIDDETIRFKTKNGGFKRVDYRELGFQDNRKKLPNKLWPIFLSFASNAGKTEKWIAKDIDRICSTLKKYFGIKARPFRYNRKQQIQECLFTFSDPRNWRN